MKNALHADTLTIVKLVQLSSLKYPIQSRLPLSSEKKIKEIKELILLLVQSGFGKVKSTLIHEPAN